MPAGREHTIRNETADEARAFVVLTPPGGMEGFARATAALDPGEVTPAAIVGLAGEHGIEITRPAPA
ncbi:MAG: hypothetical protein AB7V42_00525 [Thermoleophilia bacterium]